MGPAVDVEERAGQVRRGLLRDLAVWLRMTPEERDGSPLAGTPDTPGVFDAGDTPDEPAWYAWAPDPRDPTGDVAVVVTAADFEDVGDVLELVTEEDLRIERVGRGCCEDLSSVRDDLLDLIVTTARQVGDPDRPGEHGVLRGLILGLGLVLDVPVADANREALRRIAADRLRRAA